MELQQKDDINNLIECWKKSTANGLIMDEGRMAEFWNRRSDNYSRNIDKDQRKKRTDEILEFLEESGFNPKVPESWISGADPAPSPFLFHGSEQKLQHLIFRVECLTG
jgi:hypothetical protein